MKCLVAHLLTVVVIFASTGQAFAGFTANWTSASPAEALNVTYFDSSTNTTQTVYAWVGQYNWTRTGGDQINFVGSNGTNYWTFCTELTQDVVNPATYDIVAAELAPKPSTANGMGSTKANELRQYFGLHYSASFSNQDAAAFQDGIWKIVYGSSVTISDSTAEAKANSWLTGITGDLSHLTQSQKTIANELVALTSPTSQDQLTLQAPTPPGVVLAGIGWVAMFGYMRRRRTQA